MAKLSEKPILAILLNCFVSLSPDKNVTIKSKSESEQQQLFWENTFKLQLPQRTILFQTYNYTNLLYKMAIILGAPTLISSSFQPRLIFGKRCDTFIKILLHLATWSTLQSTWNRWERQLECTTKFSEALGLNLGQFWWASLW